jgi:nocardicin N-oxygenase
MGCPVPSYPFGPVVALDLDPRYAELRDTSPVTRVRLPYGGEGWLVTGYAEVKRLLADPRFSSLAATAPQTPRVTPLPLRVGNLLSMDPPGHSRIRRVVAQAFTVRSVERLRHRIAEEVAAALDAMAQHGPPADLVQDLAVPVPLVMICELFGIPYSERDRFRPYSDTFVATTGFSAGEVQASRDALEDYLAELVTRRRRRPADDLVGRLVAAADGEGRLSERELARTGMGILMAGHETSLSMISDVFYLLLSRRDLYARVSADVGLVPTAVEEMLRVVPLRSVGSFPRVATEDVELGGVLIRAGDAVIFQRAAADRDPRVFDRPEEIDLGRVRNPHLGFGHGAHHCLGAPLARMQLSLALAATVRRFPGLRLAVPAGEVPWKAGLIARRPERLPVTW